MDITDAGPMHVPSTSEAITDESKPDPDLTECEVAGNYLLIRPVKTNTEKVGSIYMPDSIQGDVKYLHNVGRILKVGPLAYKNKDGSDIEWVVGGLKAGDIVQWERFVGKRLRYKGVNLVLLKDTAIQLKVEHQSDLDAMTSIED